MARRVVAVLVLLACVLAVGCGGHEPNAHRGPTVKTPRPAPVAAGSGRFVAIGDGRSLYMECVGSGSPTVVLEAGFGAGTLSWRDVQPELGRGKRTCAYDRAGTGNSVAPPACVTHATRSPTFRGYSPAPASSRRTCWLVTPMAGCWRACCAPVPI